MQTPCRATVSVAIITLNEETNLPRTLASVNWADEIVIVDSGSTDATRDIAQSYGARFAAEPWSGFAMQKNLAISLCTSDWVLSLDADESVSPELAASIQKALASPPSQTAYALRRRNFFLGRWIRHGGYYPDAKLRLFARGQATFRETPVHETIAFAGTITTLVDRPLGVSGVTNPAPATVQVAPAGAYPRRGRAAPYPARRGRS